MLDISCCWHVG